MVICPTDVKPTDPRSYYQTAKRLTEETENAWYVNQYDNLSNRAAHYESTAPEIWEQTEGKLTHFVVGAGTGGTITGWERFSKKKEKDIKVIGVDTYGSILKEIHETNRRNSLENAYTYITEGIGEDILPENYDMSVIDHFEKVTDKDGAIYARKLAKEEGIFCGYSAGSAIAAIKQNARSIYQR